MYKVDWIIWYKEIQKILYVEPIRLLLVKFYDNEKVKSTYKWVISPKIKPQSDRVTDTKGYSVYGWMKFFVPDFNKLPYSLRSRGDNKLI